MMGRQYTQSGSNNKTYENVADGSTFSISGSGDAKFKGHIGNNVAYHQKRQRRFKN